MDVKNLILQLLENVKSDITQDMSAKNLNASGKTVTSIEILSDDKSGSITVPGHLFTLIEDRDDGGKGRKPGPVSIEGQESIREWIKTRNINFSKSIDSMVYLIARKLKEKGNRIYQGLVPGIRIQPIFKNNLEIFTRDLIDSAEDALRKSLWFFIILFCSSCISTGVTYNNKGVYTQSKVQSNDPRNYILGFSLFMLIDYGNDIHTKTRSKRTVAK